MFYQLPIIDNEIYGCPCSCSSDDNCQLFFSDDQNALNQQSNCFGFEYPFFDDLEINFDLDLDLDSDSNCKSEKSQCNMNLNQTQNLNNRVISKNDRREARKEMRKWLLQNQNYPYPTTSKKQFFANRYNLTISQITIFFDNERRRLLHRKGLSKRQSLLYPL